MARAATDEVRAVSLSALNTARTQLRAELQRCRRKRIRSEAQELNTAMSDRSTFWRVWRKRERRGRGMQVLRADNGDLLTKAEEMAPEAVVQLLRRHEGEPIEALEQQFVRRAVEDTSRWNVWRDQEELNEPITLVEVTAAIKKMRTNSAAGVDEVHVAFLKAGGTSLAERLVELFDGIRESCVGSESCDFPSRWRMGLVSLLYKRGSKELLSNWREVTLLSVLFKTFESVLNSRLVRFLESRSLLVDEQGGFRKGRRTEDNGFMMSEVLAARRERGEVTLLSF